MGGKTGDCLGDGVRSQKKDPSKFFLIKNSDGTLTFKSDGWPDLKMKKQSLMAPAALSGKYEGGVPFIITIDATFNGDAAVNMEINVKIAHKDIKCPSEQIAETDSQITFPASGKTGDCLGDGVPFIITIDATFNGDAAVNM